MLRILEIMQSNHTEPRAAETHVPSTRSESAKLSIVKAHQVGERTKELFDSRGWCMWKCSNLDGDIVVIVRDERVSGYPKGHPIYTDYELRELYKGGIDEGTLRIVHEAKKLAGAKVVQVIGKDTLVQPSTSPPRLI